MRIESLVRLFVSLGRVNVAGERSSAHTQREDGKNHYEPITMFNAVRACSAREKEETRNRYSHLAPSSRRSLGDVIRVT